MSEKAKLATTKHKNGYNCAQAVACAFAEELGTSEDTLFKTMEGFGFGMGCMETCGAVSAMAAIAGFKESDGNTDSPGTKKASYRAAKKMIKAFEEKNSSIICREIKGVDTGKVLRSCEGCVQDAADIIDQYLKGELE